MKLTPKTLTGILNNFNKNSSDWGSQNLFAYGCQNFVVIVDPKSVQTIQVLDRHKGYVVKVKWARQNYHHDLANPYCLRLSSADYNGHVIVWDVLQSTVRSEFSENSKPIADMEWLANQNASLDLLAVLHPPYSLILWNADTGTKLWKKSYTETMKSFSFDPFNSSNIVFLGQNCLIFIDDFSISKTPVSNGKKYYISSPTQQQVSNSTSSSSDKKAKSLSKRVSRILVGENSKSHSTDGFEPVSTTDCLQLTYHKAYRHHIILVYSREALILDLEIKQTVGILSIDRAASPFMQILSVQQKDMFYCLHENGSITVRMRRRGSVTMATTTASTTTPNTPSLEASTSLTSLDEISSQMTLDVVYDMRCQSESLRLTKNSRVYGFNVCPVNENKIFLLLSDGRLLLWEIKATEYSNDQLIQPPVSPLYSPSFNPSEALFSLEDVPQNCKLPLFSDTICPPVSIDSLLGNPSNVITEQQLNKHAGGVLLKFVLTGLTNGVAAPPLVIKMCPPLTTKNWNVYVPYIALGTGQGTVQIFNLSTGVLHREYSVHSYNVRGIEWVNLQSFLSFAYQTPANGNSLVRNELTLTNIQTGRSQPLFTSRDEEEPIETIKVSHLKQYFIVIYKEKPFELWDLRSGSLLRQMPKNFPHVTALEWSPSHNLKSLKKNTGDNPTLAGTGTAASQSSVTTSQSAQSLGELSSSSKSTSLASGDATSLEEKSLKGYASAREHFVFTDSDGLLYHFIVEGNLIKDGSKIPPDGSMGSITCIAWKGETMVLADVEGNLNIWDLKARMSRAVPTHHGWIRKIKFAPGRGNMKLLVQFNEGVDVWDTKTIESVGSLKSPRDIPKISDVDWAASDKPVLACADGSVRITDLEFRASSSQIPDNFFLLETTFLPHLLPPKVGLVIKNHLQHQQWRHEYSLDVEITDENADIHSLIQQQIKCVDRPIAEYLPVCHFGTAQRCLIVARLFGDEYETKFWSIALHYLRTQKSRPLAQNIPKSTSLQIGDLFVPTQCESQSPDSGKSEVPAPTLWPFVRDRPLESYCDILCDNATFRKLQLERISLHDSKRSSYDLTSRCAEDLIMLGETDRAVQLLLETDQESDGYYVDSLRACLIATIRSSGASQSTIKLVATNLIANGKISEGVQLLCLIDKGLDACRYLQTYGRWYHSAWLAKCTLNYEECLEVIKRWADHLSTPQVNLKNIAILILLSMGQFTAVIENLYSMRYFDMAALLIESCEEFQLEETSTEQFLTLKTGVFIEYARTLLNIGNRKAAEYYCDEAGDKGRAMLSEIKNTFR